LDVTKLLCLIAGASSSTEHVIREFSAAVHIRIVNHGTNAHRDIRERMVFLDQDIVAKVPVLCVTVSRELVTSGAKSYITYGCDWCFEVDQRLSCEGHSVALISVKVFSI
jgi:hypothetical protein